MVEPTTPIKDGSKPTEKPQPAPGTPAAAQAQTGMAKVDPNKQAMATRPTFDVPVIEDVAKRVKQFADMGIIHFPDNYSVDNALKSAELVLKDMTDKNGKPILEVVTAVSVANSLYSMCVEGLNVMKKQGSFIQYGNKITWQREYTGNIALAKRFGNLKNITGNVIYQDDIFEFEVNAETGRKRVVKHIQTMESIDNNKIKGAYAIIFLEDGTTDVEIMNYDQIKRSWQQGAAKGDSPAHKNFPDQMCLKTVKSRAVKLLIRTSDDSALVSPDADLDENPQDKPTFNEMKQELREITIDATATVVDEPKANAPEPAPEEVNAVKQPLSENKPKDDKPF